MEGKEREIILNLKLHQESAFDEIYLKYHKLVYHVIYFIVKNRETTEELVQDTFIKMYQNIETLNNTRYFRNWLLKIAKNLAYDELKKRKVNVVYDEDFVNNSLSYNDKTSDLHLDFKSILNDLEYSIVVLVLIYGLKRREIASILNLPLAKVQRVYQEGVNKIKNLYGDKNERL